MKRPSFIQAPLGSFFLFIALLLLPTVAFADPEIVMPGEDPAEGSTKSPGDKKGSSSKIDSSDAETQALTRGLADQRLRLGSTVVGGYAELHYNAVKVEDADEYKSKADLHRFVLFAAHDFGQGLRFYSELEVEHAIAGEGLPGEVSIEQAFVDFDLFKKYLTLRSGILLVPLGITNQWHEPPVFNGVERPMVDKVIIPTTWREAGVGFLGKIMEGLNYELYLVTALDPMGFSGKSGVRGGRQKGGKARADGLAFTGRVEYEPILGLVVGLSGYSGDSGSNADLFDAAGNKLDLSLRVTGGDMDFRLRRWGLELKALVASFSISDTAEFRGAMDDAGEVIGKDMGSMLLGAYAEIGWDVLYLMETEHRLVPFFRFEHYDTMYEVDGREKTADDERFAITDLVFGLSYRPIPQVVFKGDMILRSPGGEALSSTVVDLGVGVMF